MNSKQIEVIKEAILKENLGYKYIVHTLFRREYFLTIDEIRNSKDPEIKNAIPWPICDFIKAQIENGDLSPELAEIMEKRDFNRRFELKSFEEYKAILLIANFDIRALFKELNNIDVLTENFKINNLNEYQLYFIYKNEDELENYLSFIEDYISDFIKTDKQKKVEKEILSEVYDIIYS